uniref:Uncharacterized protein n=1 Tax=Knipowitschia caucasica TaxID=637954 RepID=A0AAV2LML4_KNICA
MRDEAIQNCPPRGAQSIPLSLCPLMITGESPRLSPPGQLRKMETDRSYTRSKRWKSVCRCARSAAATGPAVWLLLPPARVGHMSARHVNAQGGIREGV